METYTYHNDPAYGWLEVTRAELQRLGIEHLISNDSRQNGDRVFLGELYDVPIWIKAKKAAGEVFSLEKVFEGKNPIRDYRTFYYVKKYKPPPPEE